MNSSNLRLEYVRRRRKNESSKNRVYSLLHNVIMTKANNLTTPSIEQWQYSFLFQTQTQSLINSQSFAHVWDNKAIHSVVSTKHHLNILMKFNSKWKSSVVWLIFTKCISISWSPSSLENMCLDRYFLSLHQRILRLLLCNQTNRKFQIWLQILFQLESFKTCCRIHLKLKHMWTLWNVGSGADSPEPTETEFSINYPTDSP